jgi:micrococcal nuclease
MDKLFLFLLLVFVSCTAPAKNVFYGDVIVSEVTSIYDGDTFRVNIEGYSDLIGKHIPIRINGIDTPELRTKCAAEKALARKAKQFSVSQLRSGKEIKLTNMQRGMYFRIIADVMIDGVSLGDLLVKNNYAVLYNGGTKKDWCK